MGVSNKPMSADLLNDLLEYINKVKEQMVSPSLSDVDKLYARKQIQKAIHRVCEILQIEDPKNQKDFENMIGTLLIVHNLITKPGLNPQLQKDLKALNVLIIGHLLDPKKNTDKDLKDLLVMICILTPLLKEVMKADLTMQLELRKIEGRTQKISGKDNPKQEDTDKLFVDFANLLFMMNYGILRTGQPVYLTPSSDNAMGLDFLGRALGVRDKACLLEALDEELDPNAPRDSEMEAPGQLKVSEFVPHAHTSEPDQAASPSSSQEVEPKVQQETYANPFRTNPFNTKPLP